MVLVTAQVPIASFTLSLSHFTFCPCDSDSNQQHRKLRFLPRARLFPPACFNYISNVKKLPVAHYYSASELSLIPDTTNKYLWAGTHATALSTATGALERNLCGSAACALLRRRHCSRLTYTCSCFADAALCFAAFFCQVAPEFSSAKAGYKARELALFAQGEVPHPCCYLTHVPTFLGQRLARPAAASR